MKAKDLTGQRFGRLVALRDQGSVKNGKSRVRLWHCQCDCGAFTSKRSSSLLQGTARSCGCLRTDVCRAKVILPPGESGLNALYRHYRTSARHKKLSFTLSKDSFRTLTSQPCNYCGAPPTQESRIRNGNGAYLHNGLDRLNNRSGYDQNNAVPCCSDCNYFKGARDFLDFMTMVRRIARYTSRAGQ